MSTLSWGGWFTLPAPEQGIDSQLSVAPNEDGRLELFGIGKDRALWHIWQVAADDGWMTQWHSLGMPPGVELGTASPGQKVAVGRNEDGRLEVFALGGGSVWHIWQSAPNSGWTEWAEHPNPGGVGFSVESEIHVVLNKGGRLEVFVKNADSQIYTNGGWADDWNKLGSPPGGICGTFSVAKDAGGLELVLFSADNELWRAHQIEPRLRPIRPDMSRASGPPVGWSNWERVGSPNPGVMLCTVDALGHNKDGRLELFSRSGGRDIWHTWQSAPGVWSGSWNNLGQPPSGSLGGLALGLTSDGHLQAFTWGGEGDFLVWAIAQVAPNDGWGAWTRLSRFSSHIDVFLRPDLQVGANRDGRLEVFTYGRGDTVHHIWQTA